MSAGLAPSSIGLASSSIGLAPSSRAGTLHPGLAPSSRGGTQGFLGVHICQASPNQGSSVAPEQPGGCQQTRGLWGQREGGQGQERGPEQMTALGRKRRASDERLRGGGRKGGAGREGLHGYKLVPLGPRGLRPAQPWLRARNEGASRSSVSGYGTGWVGRRWGAHLDSLAWRGDA